MKNIILLLFMGCLLSCSSTPTIDNTYPFSESSEIEVISYPVRYEWDTIRQGEKKHLWYLVENKKLANSSGIKERIYLNEKQKQDLFNSLFVRKTNDCMTAACFDPRHAILFYNKKSEIIANIEICFDCGNSRASKGFNHNELCYEGLAGIKKIFEEAGIKYYGEGKN